MMTLRFGDVAHILRGTVPAHASEQGSGHRFFGIAEISAGGAVTRRLEADVDVGPYPVILLEGDIVLAQLGKPGSSVLINQQSAGSVLGRECLAIRLKQGDRQLSVEWLAAYLRSDRVRMQLEAATSGTTMPRLNPKQLADFELTVPSLSDQNRIVRRLSFVGAALNDQRQLLASLELLYTAEVELAIALSFSEDL